MKQINNKPIPLVPWCLGGSNTVPSICRALLISLVSITLSGCWSPAHPKTAAQPKLVAQPNEPPHGSGVPDRIILPSNILRVHVYQLTLPLGTLSLNDKVWRELNEDALDSKSAVLLARNGIRAAIGPQQRWPVIAKLL